MLRLYTFSCLVFVVIQGFFLTNGLLRHENARAAPQEQQQAPELSKLISTTSTGQTGSVNNANSNISVTGDGPKEGGAGADQQPAGESGAGGQSSNNILRFLLLGDWGKGGNSGKYMSSYNKSLHGNVSLDDSSDLSGAGMSSLANSTTTVQDGGNQALYQPQVAKAMGTYATKADPAPSFVMALGDNFYTKGVSSATDSLWGYLWEDVYLGYSGLNIPWYPVFGNHDYGSASAVQAQIDRYNLHKNNDIWQFPSTNYSKIFEIPGGEGASVGIVFIDSTTLAPSMNGCCNSKGGISEEEQARRIKNQLYHINRMLAELVAAQVTWLLVAGHYPVFSAGSSGDPSEMTSYLLPLLQQYNVHAYICGHDHTSIHMQYKDYPTQYFVVGAGSMTDSLYYKSKSNLIWGGPGYAAFGYMAATSTYLEFGIINTNNEVKYQYKLTNPFALKIPPASMPSSSPTFRPPPPPLKSPVPKKLDQNGTIVMVSAGSVAVAGILIAVLFLYRSSSDAKSKLKNEDKENASGKSLLLMAAPMATTSTSQNNTTLPTDDPDEDDDEERGDSNRASHRILTKSERRARRNAQLTATYEALREEQVDQDHDQEHRRSLSIGSDFEPQPLALNNSGKFAMPSKAPPSSPIDHSKYHKRAQSLHQSRGDILSVAIDGASTIGVLVNTKTKSAHRRVQTMAI